MTAEARYAYRERSTKAHSVESYKEQRMMEDPFLKKRLEYSNEKASDYSTVFLPWGPSWTAKRIRKLMMTKDIVLNSDWSASFTARGYHTHPCFIGTLEEVIQDCCGHCPPVPASVDRESLECFVSGPLSFLVDDPGRQTIGSFHPITTGDWSTGAYLAKDTDELMQAANSNNAELLREMVSRGVNVNTTDSLGRTALHIATLSNCMAAVEALLDMGADATLHMKDGRNVIHIAAEYGYLSLLELLLQRLKLGKKNHDMSEESPEGLDLDEVNKTTQMTALHYAVLFGHVDCCEYLLENGATCDQMIWSSDKSTGVSVLVLAAHCEYFSKQVAIDLYCLLHRFGASLKLVDQQLNNVMHVLCRFNYVGFVEYLMEHDPIAVSLCSDLNSAVMNAVGVAIENGFFTLAKCLIEHGAALRVTEEDVKKVSMKFQRTRGLRCRLRLRGGYSTRITSEYCVPPLMMVMQRQTWTDSSYDFVEIGGGSDG